MNQLVLASPIGRWPVYQLETGEPFDMSAWYNWVGGVGAACWLVAYVITIVRGFKEKTFGIPLVAICLNFTWELMDSFFLPDPILLWKVIDYAWLLMDFVIVYQLWRFGEREQFQPELRKYFHPMVLLLMGCAFLGQYSWVTTFHDTLGLVLAFVINLVMSALFIGFFFERRATGRGLSLPVAWLKMLGRALPPRGLAENVGDGAFFRAVLLPDSARSPGFGECHDFSHICLLLVLVWELLRARLRVHRTCHSREEHDPGAALILLS